MNKDNKALNWDTYFMAIAQVSAFRSKDPNTKVGALITNDKKIVISSGYNGMPKGNDNFPWQREASSEIQKKYSYVIHAEANAILNSHTNISDCVIYTTLFPCSNCSKTIVQAGIKEVVYLHDFYNETEDNQISKIILTQSGVSFRQINDFSLTIETDQNIFTNKK